MLIDGLRANLQEVADRGIDEASISGMEETLTVLAQANQECDELRSLLAQKVKNMNTVLAKAKSQFADTKKTIKGYYPQEEWNRFGIPDKR